MIITAAVVAFLAVIFLGFGCYMVIVCNIIRNNSQPPSLDRKTNDNIRKKNMDTSENIQLRWREKTHF